MKNPLTQPGIEPATFRFLAQHLNHYATAVPLRLQEKTLKIFSCFNFRIVIGICGEAGTAQSV